MLDSAHLSLQRKSDVGLGLTEQGLIINLPCHGRQQYDMLLIKWMTTHTVLGVAVVNKIICSEVNMWNYTLLLLTAADKQCERSQLTGSYISNQMRENQSFVDCIRAYQHRIWSWLMFGFWIYKFWNSYVWKYNSFPFANWWIPFPTNKCKVYGHNLWS